MARRSSVPNSGSSASSVRARGGADAGHAAQQVVVRSPDRTALNRGVDVPVGVRHPFFEPPDVVAQVAGDGARGRPELGEPLPFGGQHLQ